MVNMKNIIYSNNKIEKKKLLILGANPETVPLIETAKQMGVYVIVTDNDPKAYAKPFADKSFNVDGMDVDGLINLARQENVDGVLVGVADRLIVPYQKVCAALDKPCYGSEMQCDVLTDKERFNEICTKNKIPTIPNYKIDNEFQSYKSISIDFPVLVKPVDGNSGKGMSICRSNADLILAIEKAKKMSKRRKYLVEKYMDCDDMFIYYTFRNGEIMVSAIADRYTSKEQGDLGKVCIGAIYPSKYAELYFKKLHHKMISLFKELDMKNGILMISAFIEHNEIYLYDPGFRLQGEAPNIPIEAVCGYDQKAMLVEFALGGYMGKSNLKELSNYMFDGKYASTLWVLSKSGTIEIIQGLEEAHKDNNVYKVVQRLFEGDTILKNMIGTEAQVVARIYLVTDTKDSLMSTIDNYAKTIRVINDNGQDMLMTALTSTAK